MQHTLTDLLTIICRSQEWENYWIDLLSQMEYIGVRKIIKSIAYEKLTIKELKHIRDESTHAYLLKSLNEKRGYKKNWKENPWSSLGFQYFNELDKAISQFAKNAYFCVTFIVEKRVFYLYPLYEKITESLDVKSVIQQILKDEREHFSMVSDLKTDEVFLQKITEIETILWNKLVSEISNHL